MTDKKIKEIENRLDKIEKSSKEWSSQKVAYYASLRNAWHINRQSSTKSILSLSTAGIGLLIGLSNFLSFSSTWQFIAFLCSIIFFGITIILVFLTWRNNGDLNNILIKDCINTAPTEEKLLNYLQKKKEKILNCLDIFILISFSIAIATAIIFAAFSINNKTPNKGDDNVKGKQQITSSAASTQTDSTTSTKATTVNRETNK